MIQWERDDSRGKTSVNEEETREILSSVKISLPSFFQINSDSSRSDLSDFSNSSEPLIVDFSIFGI